MEFCSIWCIRLLNHDDRSRYNKIENFMSYSILKNFYNDFCLKKYETISFCINVLINASTMKGLVDFKVIILD